MRTPQHNSQASPAISFAQNHAHSLEVLGSSSIDLSTRIRQWMVEHNVVFAGQPIPFTLAPYCIDNHTLNQVKQAVDVLTRVLDRFCSAFRSNALLRQELALPVAETDLISIEPTLDQPLQLCRLDAFLLADNTIKFLEFNAESPAGIGYADVMFDGLHAHLETFHSPPSPYDVSYQRILPHLIDTVRDVEARWRFWASSANALASRLDVPKHCSRPRVMLVDTEDSPSIPEFQIICAALEQAGFEAGWAALKDLTFINGRLENQGMPIDVVYRRALVDDMLDPRASAGAAALIAAVRAGSVAMLNPFAARVANNKKLLALLGDPNFTQLIDDEEERDVVNRCLPWTRVLAPKITTLPDKSLTDTSSYVKENRETLVLKPASDYGGHNVWIGKNTEQHIWDALVHAHSGTGDWIVQEYLDIPTGTFPVIEDGRLLFEQRYFNINPFAISGRYAGMITRISTEPVINVSAGGGLLPCVVINDC